MAGEKKLTGHSRKRRWHAQRQMEPVRLQYDVPEWIPQIELLTAENFSQFANLVSKDYKHFKSTHKFHNTPIVKELLIPQSIEGRARSGHGMFRSNLREDQEYIFRYDATIDDVVRALCLTAPAYKRDVLGLALDNSNMASAVNRFKECRQRLIDQIGEFAGMLLDRKRLTSFTVAEDFFNYFWENKKEGVEGRRFPLAGNRHFLTSGGVFDHKRRSINPGAVLLGLIFASRIDSVEYRAIVEEQYGIEMSKGSSYIIHTPTLRKHNILMNWLANFAHDPNPRWHEQSGYSTYAMNAPHITTLQDAGIILSQDQYRNLRNKNEAVQGYVRHSLGYGIDDDAGMVTSGLILALKRWKGLEDAFNTGKQFTSEDIIDVCTGWYLGDFIDTFDKSTERMEEGGQDENLGRRIVESLRLDRDVLEELEAASVDVIYLSRIRKETYKASPNSSQRYFLQERNLNQHQNGAKRFEKSNGQGTACGFESHIMFVRKFYQDILAAEQKGWPSSAPQAYDMKMGFKKVHSPMFYEKMRQELIEYVKKGI